MGWFHLYGMPTNVWILRAIIEELKRIAIVLAPYGDEEVMRHQLDYLKDQNMSVEEFKRLVALFSSIGML